MVLIWSDVLVKWGCLNVVTTAGEGKFQLKIKTGHTQSIQQTNTMLHVKTFIRLVRCSFPWLTDKNVFVEINGENVSLEIRSSWAELQRGRERPGELSKSHIQIQMRTYT